MSKHKSLFFYNEFICPLNQNWLFLLSIILLDININTLTEYKLFVKLVLTILSLLALWQNAIYVLV